MEGTRVVLSRTQSLTAEGRTRVWEFYAAGTVDSCGVFRLSFCAGCIRTTRTSGKAEKLTKHNSAA